MYTVELTFLLPIVAEIFDQETNVKAQQRSLTLYRELRLYLSFTSVHTSSNCVLYCLTLMLTSERDQN